MARRKIKKVVKKKVIKKAVKKVAKKVVKKAEEIKEVKVEVKKQKMVYGGEFPKDVRKIEDAVDQNGTPYKIVHLIDGSVEPCSLEDFEKRTQMVDIN